MPKRCWAPASTIPTLEARARRVVFPFTARETTGMASSMKHSKDLGHRGAAPTSEVLSRLPIQLGATRVASAARAAEPHTREHPPRLRGESSSNNAHTAQEVKRHRSRLRRPPRETVARCGAHPTPCAPARALSTNRLSPVSSHPSPFTRAAQLPEPDAALSVPDASLPHTLDTRPDHALPGGFPRRPALAPNQCIATLPPAPCPCRMVHATAR